jgi:hypothetical protein
METFEAIIEKSRYPGVSPFSENQQAIFFGRDIDIRNITQLINVRRQVLLYAKSGVGKTSLLMAGVLPNLRDRYAPLKIRFTSYTERSDYAPVQAVISTLPDCSGNSQTLLDKISLKADIKKTLWYQFKQQQLYNPQTVWLLVFDQFEELFTYPVELINDFKQQLYDLIHSEVPGEIVDLLDEDAILSADKDINILYEEPEIKIIYAIRSDRLNLLNQLTDKIPDIQRDFYELKPLDDKQAREAIEGPAGKEGDFTVPRFNFPGEIMDDILERLTKYGKENLETTQLQIVCQQIEENIFSKNLENPEGSHPLTVEVKDIPDFKDIFYEFYNDSIKQISENFQTSAHLLIENQLIFNKRRISLDGFICTETLPDNELQKLVKAHLLRAEPNNMGGFNYELSHDTLVEPIYEAAERRRKKEKEEAAVKARENDAKRQAELLAVEQTRAAEAERIVKKQQKQKNAIIILATLFAIATIVCCLKWIQADRIKNWAVLEEKKAKRNEQIFDSLLTSKTVIEYKEYYKYLENAANLAEKGDYKLALEQLNNAKVIAGDDNAKIKLIEDQKKIYYAKTDNENKYRELMAKAQSYEQTEATWPEAIKVYEEALLLNLHADIVKDKMKTRENEIRRKLNEYRLLTENLLDNGIPDKALEGCILPALKLCSPDHNSQDYEYFTQMKNGIAAKQTGGSKLEFPVTNEGAWIIVFAADKDLDQALNTNKNLNRAGISDVIILLKDEQFFNISGEFRSREEALIFMKKAGPRVRRDVYVTASAKFCMQKIPRGAFFICQ